MREDEVAKPEQKVQHFPACGARVPIPAGSHPVGFSHSSHATHLCKFENSCEIDRFLRFTECLLFLQNTAVSFQIFRNVLTPAVEHVGTLKLLYGKPTQRNGQNYFFAKLSYIFRCVKHLNISAVHAVDHSKKGNWKIFSIWKVMTILMVMTVLLSSLYSFCTAQSNSDRQACAPCIPTLTCTYGPCASYDIYNICVCIHSCL